MNKILKDKKILAGIAVVILAILIVSGVFVLTSKNNSKVNTQQASQEEQVLTLSPDAIGLNISLSEDGHKVTVEVAKVSDITSLNYDLTYTAKGDIQRGTSGEEIKPEGKPIKKVIDLGTCSDVCHYDEGVSNIKVILKVIKTDGKTYQVEKSL